MVWRRHILLIGVLLFLGLWLTACGPQQASSIDGYVLSTQNEIQYLSWQEEDTNLTGILELERLNPYQGDVESHTLSITGTKQDKQLIIRETPTTTVTGMLKDDNTIELERTIWYGVSTADWNALKKAFPAYIHAQQQIEQLKKVTAYPPDQVTGAWMEQAIKGRRAYIQDLVTQLDNLEQEPDHAKRCLNMNDFQSLYQRGYDLLPEPGQTAIGKQLQLTQDAMQVVKASPVSASLRVPQPWKQDVSLLEKGMQPGKEAMQQIKETYTKYHPEDLTLKQQYDAIGDDFHRLQASCK